MKQTCLYMWKLLALSSLDRILQLYSGCIKCLWHKVVITVFMPRTQKSMRWDSVSLQTRLKFIATSWHLKLKKQKKNRFMHFSLNTYSYVNELIVLPLSALWMQGQVTALMSLCPFGWGRRIHQLHLYRGVRPPQMMVVWLFGFYGISTFVGYLMLNPFLNK